MSGTVAQFQPGPASPPNLADFTTMLTNEVQIPASVMASSVSQIQTALTMALEWVYRPLQRAAPWFYTRAVYCFATDWLVQHGQDPIGSGSSGFFAGVRAQYKIGAFVAGVLSSASDNGTSQGMTVPKSLQNLTIADLQNMKTPWGLEYLSILQQVGPIWGLS